MNASKTIILSLVRTDHICQRNLRSVEEVFFQTCDRELAKVNHFYSERLTEVQARLTSLKLALRTLHESQRAKHGSRTKLRWLLQVIRMDSGQQTERELKVAVVELYYSMLLLRSYRELNYIGFCKIMRKHGKRFNSQQGVKWRKEKLETSELHSSRRICQLISELELLMCQLMGGDRQKAMKKLNIPTPATEEESVPDWTAFRLGVTCGLLLALLNLIALRAIQKPDWDPVRPLLRLYRGGFLLIEFLFLLGVNIYGWKRSGINYVLIFELNREDNLSYYHMFEVAGCLAVCWCLSVLACLHAPLPPVPLQLQPLLFYCLPILLLLNPTPTLHHRFRRWLLSLLGRVLTAPFHPVGFADFWLADQLNSLSALFLDMWGLICFYGCEVSWRDLPSMDAPPAGRLDCEELFRSMSCLIQCFPPWLRFAQCIRNFWDSGDTRPHLLNAGKYSTVFMTVTFAGLFSMNTEDPTQAVGMKLYLYLWAAATCLSVLVTITWDLWMDWGLLQGPELLRKEVVYSQQAFYYGAMLADVLLRVAWGINIILIQIRNSDLATVTGVLAPLEVVRRFIWNFFRLENEHLNNCRQFRAFRDIPMTPVALNGHSVLERVMDQEDTAKAHWKENVEKSKA
ncbi:xenotropic and polytropic retrovirus receptor 1 homolog [Scleropages formosus]|uniref:xenotropic and polytropic retrovirus receptor 1 homolog n=1 Tax=Scleropages formosus TaxID=113540 RepID=UPI0010FA81DE|nr:xenotropic and polytropic retrovirus receptor 1 homolog [Scleropages formosus]